MDFREYINKDYYLQGGQTSLEEFTGQKSEKKINSTPYTINNKISDLEDKLKISFSELQKRMIKYLHNRPNYDYGCYEFAFLKELNCEKTNKELESLFEKKIIRVREKKSKAQVTYDFYYLSHPKLVNRNNYLYFKDEIFLYKGKKFKKVGKLYINLYNIFNYNVPKEDIDVIIKKFEAKRMARRA